MVPYKEGKVRNATLIRMCSNRLRQLKAKTWPCVTGKKNLFVKITSENLVQLHAGYLACAEVADEQRARLRRKLA